MRTQCHRRRQQLLLAVRERRIGGCRPHRRRRRARQRLTVALDPHREPCAHVSHRRDIGARRRSRDHFRSAQPLICQSTTRRFRERRLQGVPDLRYPVDLRHRHKRRFLVGNRAGRLGVGKCRTRGVAELQRQGLPAVFYRVVENDDAYRLARLPGSEGERPVGRGVVLARGRSAVRCDPIHRHRLAVVPRVERHLEVDCSVGALRGARVRGRYLPVVCEIQRVGGRGIEVAGPVLPPAGRNGDHDAIDVRDRTAIFQRHHWRREVAIVQVATCEAPYRQPTEVGVILAGYLKRASAGVIGIRDPLAKM